jgi:DNA-binding response OmpR family regulator
VKILVLDDDSLITDLLEGLLTEWGHEPLVFNKSTEALATLARDGAPQLVILDWNMPMLNGLHICQTIRKISGDRTSIIMLTSNSGGQHVIKALAAGANNYIVKPFEPEDLKARIESSIHEIALKAATNQIQSNAA